MKGPFNDTRASRKVCSFSLSELLAALTQRSIADVALSGPAVLRHKQTSMIVTHAKQAPTKKQEGPLHLWCM